MVDSNGQLLSQGSTTFFSLVYDFNKLWQKNFLIVLRIPLPIFPLFNSLGFFFFFPLTLNPHTIIIPDAQGGTIETLLEG